MLNQELINLMNEQINKEIYSAYLYYGIASFYESNNLAGFAHYFKLQAKEELEHADKFATYLHENDAKVTLSDIEKPRCSYNDFKEPLLLQLEHEKLVTASIIKLYEVATENKDYFSISFLKTFIDEQYEEEKTAKDLISEFELFALDTKGVFEFSEKLGSRK